jgi:hypothetical protein
MPASPDKRIREAARKAASARSALEREIRAAHPALSLRAIASAAGVSHEQVRRIISAA